MNGKPGSIFVTLPRTQRGMPLVLGGDPKGKTFLYPHGNSIIIRDIENPLIADVYTEHCTQTTCAKYSPSGFYIASADQSGKVRIWDTTQKEHILKNEYQPFAGIIKDLSWSPDNQRICVVGEGRERFGHVFMADTGTSVGEIAGHSNIINSCDFRPKRPFRIVTASEDNSVGVYEGPPFKSKTYLSDHTRFVQSVRFSPNGDLFASGGFDGKMFLYKCDDYSKVGEFGDPAHAGGVYAVSWSPDGTKLLSASGDKSCKVWDVSTLSVIAQCQMGNDIADQQVSCLWQGQHMLSVSLSGFINYIDINDPSKLIKTIKGHNKSITALAISVDDNQVYTASHDSAVMCWDLASGEHDRIKGVGHSNQVQNMTSNSDCIYTCSLDDTMKFISKKDHQYQPETIKFDSQPRSVACGKDGTILVACLNEICIVEGNSKTTSFPIDFEGTSISVHPTESDVAVGGARDMKVHIYLLNGHNFSLKTTMEHRGAITDVAYSPNGMYLAASDSNRKVVLYNASTYELAHNHEWGFHTAKVNCLGWCPNSLYLASGSLDTHIIVWSTEQPTKHIMIKNAHPQSQITRIGFLDNTTVVSTGQDSNVKIWDIVF
ncbi:actin-interacting protein 1-like isoform X2 [Argiope bruennichi]|uniref:actin-interacting protein 1-like isoform X2 n=1 Tax=Argiope bruennichi TaxID=94029 RepID=UPI00249412BD|nr:actin-interacting protein 1-like isoform X2 [Argiope bruennichi]